MNAILRREIHHPFERWSNSLVHKEICLLRPAFLIALILAILPVWIKAAFRPADINLLEIGLVFLGEILLALSSFGREFSLGTFSSLLAQPVDREKVFRTKLIMVTGAIGLISFAFVCSVTLCAELNSDPVWDLDQTRSWLNSGWIPLSALVILSSGFWATLLLRQMAAAFWPAILIPVTLTMLLQDWHKDPIPFGGVLMAYSLVGLWWSRRSFIRAQEVGWTGGNVDLPAWGSKSTVRQEYRSYRPFSALLSKDFQWIRLGLAGMFGLFALHCFAVWLRKLAIQSPESSFAMPLLEAFGGIWFFCPIFLAGLLVGEERRMGLALGQGCLPVSHRIQFVIKFALVMFFGGLISGGLLWLAEGIGEVIGAHGGFAEVKIALDGEGLVTMLQRLLIASFLAFYAATFSGNLLQSLGVTILLAPSLPLFWKLLELSPVIRGVRLWDGPLLPAILNPLMIVALTYLAFRNLSASMSLGRLCRRNFLGLLFTLLAGTGLTAAIYNRIWEPFLPEKWEQGPSRLGLNASSRFEATSVGASLVLPDGRLWRAYWAGGRIDDGKHLVDGSNYVSQVLCRYRECVGIRADGTLWSSESTSNLTKMVRFGTEANWKEVVCEDVGRGLTLLRSDGTLWRWGDPGPNVSYPLLRDVEPQRVDQANDWARLAASYGRVLAWKTNGNAWVFNFAVTDDQGKGMTSVRVVSSPQFSVSPVKRAVRCGFLDHTQWRNPRIGPFNVRADGTLWWLDGNFKIREQVGTDRDWDSAAVGHFRPNHYSLIARKLDGSLWEWDMGGEELSSPSRVWSKNQWVGIGQGEDWSIVALAADGRIWKCPSPETDNSLPPSWLAKSSIPILVGVVAEGK